MNIKQILEVILPIQQVFLSESAHEMASILDENPRLREPETLKNMMWMSQEFKNQDGMDWEGEFWETVAAKIVAFPMSQVESSESQSSPPIPSIKSKAMWAIKARRSLALRTEELLYEAIAEAHGETEIIAILKAFPEGNYDEADRLIEQLYPKLERAERHQEAFTLNLFTLDRRISFITSEEIQIELRQQAIEMGIKACQKAIEIAQILNDKPCLAFYLTVLGIGYGKIHQPSDAEKVYDQALQLYRDLAGQEPDIFNPYVANALINLGMAQTTIRKLADAEKSYAEAMQLHRGLAGREPDIFNHYLADTLNGLAVVQHNMRKLADAENSFSEALPLYQNLAFEEPHIFNQYLAETLNGLGIVQTDMGKRADAVKSYTEALQLYRVLAEQESPIFKQYLAGTLNNLGKLQHDMRKLADAENSVAEALQIRRGLAKQEPDIFKLDVVASLDGLGIVQSDLGKTADAENSFNEALQLLRDLAGREPDIFNHYFAAILNNLGALQLQQENLDEAEENFKSARNLIEDLGAKAITIDDRRRVFQANINVYKGLLVCYLRKKDWKKALEIAELGKSRSLSDLLNLKSKDLQPKAPTSDTLVIVEDLGKKYFDAIKELQQIESYEKYLGEQLNQFENAIKRIKDDNENDYDIKQDYLRQIAEQKQPLEEEKRKALDQRFALQTELKSILEEINKYDKDFPPKAKDINAENIFKISKDQNRTIVMFRILSESTAVIFVFTTGELHIEEIKGLGQNEMLELFLNKWLIPYHQWKCEEIGMGQWKAAIAQTLDTVYEKLMIHIRQVLKEKSDCKEVLFVPNQSLALLPLHAASWKDEAGKKHYLLEEYSISYAPSVSVFIRCQENEKQRSNKTLFVTNPTGDLDSSEKEVSFIEVLHQPTKNLLGKDATKAAVFNALGEDYSFTHFACHGFYNPENPFDSGLVMFDEVIKLSEIINGNLQSNWLTTLSACETGMVDFLSPTDEHFGLPLGFIFAGSPSVWASLWSVSDMATSELMQKAYENLSLEEYKNNKPEALRQAQLAMLKDYPHPFFWAGFQHFGV